LGAARTFCHVGLRLQQQQGSPQASAQMPSRITITMGTHSSRSNCSRERGPSKPVLCTAHATAAAARRKAAAGGAKAHTAYGGVFKDGDTAPRAAVRGGGLRP
jgi:hypothetical protein